MWDERRLQRPGACALKLGSREMPEPRMEGRVSSVPWEPLPAHDAPTGHLAARDTPGVYMSKETEV